MSLQAVLDEATAGLEHERNLRGVTLVECDRCGGSGEREPGYIDSDAHGSYWVSAQPCHACQSRGRVEAPCSAEVHIAAIDREIARLRQLRRSAKRRKAR